MQPRDRRMGARDSPDHVAGSSPIEETLATLRSEINGLRAAGQLRAVIEQAKGILVERHGISLDEAFTRLRRMSQEHNVRLVEVAATIVGVAVPRTGDEAGSAVDEALLDRLPRSPAASPAWQGLQQQPDVRDGVMAALLDTVVGATRDGDEAAKLLLELLAPHGAVAITMFRVAIDGSLRLVGEVGMPGDLVSSWRSVPPSPDLPLVRAVLEGRPHLWRDGPCPSPLFDAEPADPTSAFEVAAAIPIRADDQPIGVVGVLWQDRARTDQQALESALATVRRVAPLMLQHVAAADPELEWLATLLRLHLDPWILLEAIPSVDGSRTADFVVQDVAEQVSGGGQWLGRRMLEIWPHLAEDGTIAALAGLVRTGGSWTMTVGVETGVPWGSVGSRVRAVRLGRRVVVVWRPRAG